LRSCSTDSRALLNAGKEKKSRLNVFEGRHKETHATKEPPQLKEPVLEGMKIKRAGSSLWNDYGTANMNLKKKTDLPA